MQTNIKEYDESFDLTQALQKKGTKEYGFIHLAQRANGSWVNIPIMLAVGAQDGPTLVVDACNHGDEYEGTEGIIKTFEGLDVSKMKGSFIGIPALNAEAFAEMKRYNTLDFVPQDLNRIYPGGTGPMTAYVCSWYCENSTVYLNEAPCSSLHRLLYSCPLLTRNSWLMCCFWSSGKSP